jgi:hypothetical protein
MSRRSSVALLVSAAVLAWLYGGDLLDYWRAKHAEVSAMSELPRLWFACTALLGTIAGGAAAAWARRTKSSPDYRAYRLLPIWAVLALFVDFLVLQSASPLSSAEELWLGLHAFQRRAQEVADERGLPRDAQGLSDVLDALGSGPPYLEQGAPAREYRLQVRHDCAGPVEEAPGSGVGTILYCVSGDGRTAWITAVALPAEQRFGPPRVFSVGGQVRALVVTTPAAAR